MEKEIDQDEEEKEDDKKSPTTGIVLQIKDYTISCDKLQFILKMGGSYQYYPTIGNCFDAMFENECKKEFVKNTKKDDILAVSKCIKKAERYISEVVLPLLDTKEYKHLKNKWEAKTEVELL